MELVPMKDCPGWFECLGCGGKWNVESGLCPACSCKQETQESVCEEADRLVSTDRGSHYGHPLDDFSKVTGAARALGVDPHKGPEHHALYMVLVKISRLVETPGHHDSIVDGCGYFKTYDMVLKERARRGQDDTFA